MCRHLRIVGILLIQTIELAEIIQIIFVLLKQTILL